MLPDQIKFYMDGEMYFKFKPADFVETPSFKEWLLTSSPIMNIAVEAIGRSEGN